MTDPSYEVVFPALGRIRVSTAWTMERASVDPSAKLAAPKTAVPSKIPPNPRIQIEADPAAPDQIHWAPGLPKTRSGKIMRRLLRDIAEGRELGDVTTLRDPDVVEELDEVVKRRAGEGDEE